ncbi:MAG: hypothetical protein DMF56_06950 [Acidobacteria bacterium]|nr:MAG: hypothetical protein DMF56_06950 [Acidobacteriota bacterium]
MREGSVADKRCENGHFIDESWDICPYCPQETSEPEIAVVRPTRVPESPAAAPVPMPMRQPTRAAASAAAAAAPALALQSPPPQERTVAASRLETAGSTKRYVVGWLIGLNGASRGESFPVRMGRNVIGRDRRSDVVIVDDQASSHHADLVFRPEERRFILMDHNSTNGTYVNETEIEPRRDLIGKDVIRIGSHRFLFMPLCHDGFFWDDEGLLK